LKARDAFIRSLPGKRGMPLIEMLARPAVKANIADALSMFRRREGA